MPTLLSDKYAEVLAAMASSEDEDASQVAADEFARAIEETDEIHMQGALRVDGDIGFGVAPVTTPDVSYDDTDLTALAGTVSDLLDALVALGLITRS